jgi:SUKH-3 immunity protein
MNEIPVSVLPLFRAAGWHEGRRVPTSRELRVEHPATAILSEFGGLTVGKTGPGEECATSDVAFHEVLPTDSLIPLWSKLLGKPLIGVAEVHNAHGELYVDSSGGCFFLSLMDDSICFAGSSFAEAIERLLLGRRCRPMLRPDQQHVSLYGETISAGDPRVYEYR